jgi:hypothetical protein
LACTVTASDLKVPPYCPVLGISLASSVGVASDASPTVDRLRPELGYVPGNVVVMSNLANRIKSTGSSMQVMQVAQWMRNHGL